MVARRAIPEYLIYSSDLPKESCQRFTTRMRSSVLPVSSSKHSR